MDSYLTSSTSGAV